MASNQGLLQVRETHTQHIHTHYKDIYYTNVHRCFVWVYTAVPPSAGLYPQDCHEIYQLGIKENGIYTIQPDPKRPALEVQTFKCTEKCKVYYRFKKINK